MATATNHDAATTPLRHFGSSGVRGPPQRIDADFALRLGRAVGATWKDLVVGRDARLTGPALEHAFIAGALASGANVRRLGIVPTPLVAHAARDHALGVQVTASHNPAPDNGFKLWRPSGAALNHAGLVAIEAALDAQPSYADWQEVGTLRDDPAPLESYVDATLAAVRSRAAGNTRPLDGMRIAVDCAHGAGAVITPLVLSRLGASLHVVGGTPDGRFPDRPSEPTAEHLAAFIRTVATSDADLGIAHDGDADRTVLVTPDGQLVDNVRLMTVLAQRRGDTKAAVPVDASGILEDSVPGLAVTRTPVGDIHVSRAIQDGAATIGCEPSGTWFFAEWSPTPEGPYAAAYLATMIAQDPTILAALAALPPYHRASQKTPWPDGWDRARADEATPRIRAALTEQLDDVALTTTDGIHARTPDGWVLVRPSGTEPLFRVTAESSDDARMHRLLAAGQAALAAALEGGAS